MLTYESGCVDLPIGTTVVISWTSVTDTCGIGIRLEVDEASRVFATADALRKLADKLESHGRAKVANGAQQTRSNPRPSS